VKGSPGFGQQFNYSTPPTDHDVGDELFHSVTMHFHFHSKQKLKITVQAVRSFEVCTVIAEEV
jgi:hypothetical protein